MKKIPIIVVVIFIYILNLVACNGSPLNPAISTEIEALSATEDLNNNAERSESNKGSSAYENAPDLSGETIVIYLIGDTAPPYTAITASVRDGAEDYVAYLNANGGIFGATVELRFADTGGSAEGVLTAYERFSKSDDNILIMLEYGGFEGQLYEHVNDTHIPFLTFGLDPSLPGIDESGYIFRLTPTYPEQFIFFLDFVLNNWEKVRPGGAIDEIKVAYISWDNEYGRSALSDEARAYAASKGIEIVLEEYLEMATSTSVTSAIFNAEVAGATVIYTNTHEFGVANLLSDLHNLAIHDFFIVGGNNWALDVGMFEFLPDMSFSENFYSPTWYAWWTDTDNRGIHLAEDILETYGGDDRDKTAGRLLIQGGLDLSRWAIDYAILEVGYENITGEDIYRALDNLSGYAVMEGLFIVDYSDGERAPTLLQMRQVQGETGQLVTVEEFRDIPEFKP